MIENPLFFKRSSVVRLLSYVPGSFSPRGVSHRPCSFGLNFIPPSLYPPVAFFSSSKVCLTSTFPLNGSFGQSFCPLLSPFDTQMQVCREPSVSRRYSLEWLFWSEFCPLCRF
ncbi:hypothetical protein TNCT_199601 [Trichonephila clavata]|uniref:Uncharacterized protein n=1 Tax=Trichonephila clavata TaxID=2740835 RepID=A0A8X6H6Y1_TRICU|nr:hypothetical protein TNCT_199601 [Trichonephila clavata]